MLCLTLWHAVPNRVATHTTYSLIVIILESLLCFYCFICFPQSLHKYFILLTREELVYNINRMYIHVLTIVRPLDEDPLLREMAGVWGWEIPVKWCVPHLFRIGFLHSQCHRNHKRRILHCLHTLNRADRGCWCIHWYLKINEPGQLDQLINFSTAQYLLHFCGRLWNVV